MDGSDYYSVLSWLLIGSNFFFSGSDVVNYDSGYESWIGFKFCRRRSKGKFGLGDLRWVFFGIVSEWSGSEICDNGSEVVFLV